MVRPVSAFGAWVESASDAELYAEYERLVAEGGPAQDIDRIQSELEQRGVKF